MLEIFRVIGYKGGIKKYNNNLSKNGEKYAFSFYETNPRPRC